MHCAHLYEKPTPTRAECAKHGCPSCGAFVANENRLRTEGAKAERRAVLLRVAGEMKARAAQRSGTHPMAIVEVGVLLQLADQYEREAAEVK